MLLSKYGNISIDVSDKLDVDEQSTIEELLLEQIKSEHNISNKKETNVNDIDFDEIKRKRAQSHH